MANTNDGSGKGPPKPGPDATPKKPSAIIDLKASGVDIRDIKPIESGLKGAGSSATASTGASAPSDKSAAPAPTRPAGSTATAAAISAAARKPDDKSTSPAGGAGAAATGAASTGAAATGKPSATAASPGPASKPAAAGSSDGARSAPPPSSPPPHKPASGGGLRGAATHLVAGIAGGLLALIGADKLAPQLGLTGAGQPPAATAALEGRIKALESQPARPAGDVAALSKKLAAAEQRLAALEPVGRNLGNLAEQQQRLAAQTKALESRFGQGGAAGAASDDRVTRLEERLAALAKAAEGDPQAWPDPPARRHHGPPGRPGIERVGNQLTALRKSVTQEVDSRLSTIAEASEAARNGTQRIDRELAGVKTQSAQVSQRIDGLKSAARSAGDRAQGRQGRGSRPQARDRRHQDRYRQELEEVARPNDVTAAVAPVAGRIAASRRRCRASSRARPTGAPRPRVS